MLQVINRWFQRYFSDPQAVLLVILLVASITVLMTMGGMLIPVLTSIVIAYLLEGIIVNLQCWHIRRSIAVLLVFSVFSTVVIFISFILFPLVTNQLSRFIKELPDKIIAAQQLLMQLPTRYPDFFSPDQVEGLISAIHAGARDFGQALLSYSLSSIPAIFTLSVYLVLVPMLVFFFLKDKTLILNWLVAFLPKERTAANKVWREMDAQIGNYVRGKVYEIFIVGIFTYLGFAVMGLNYASLLAVLVGLSVIIPYIGVVVITVPVVIVAYFQWGWGPDLIWALTIYLVIQALDGNVLVPLLFSEAVNLHPVAIIVAVVVFGGLWGFWGIFFAIPLATLVKALIAAWPRTPIDTAPNMND